MDEQMYTCPRCGDEVDWTEAWTCHDCGDLVCDDCYDHESRMCLACLADSEEGDQDG